MSKTICLITDWYPTEDNPYRGSFFKEQAFLVADEFHFIVIHYREAKRKLLQSRFYCRKIKQEKNTTEYELIVNVPLIIFAADFMHDYRVKHVDKTTEDGVGRYISRKRQEYLRETIICAFNAAIKENFDVLYCVDAQTEAFIIQCVAEHFNKPYILGEHGVVPWPGGVIQDINKHAIEKGNLFLAISNDKIRQLLIQNIKLPPIFYIGNLIDERKLTIKSKDDITKTLLIVASHSFYKNYDMFIAVMSRLKEIATKPFKVMIVGYGANKGYSKNAEALELKIKESNFADISELIPAVAHEDIAEIYHQADAFIMTSIQEGQPVSALEAACCGLPIFSTRCGGVEDYVNEDIGRIFDITDVEGMANGLNAYLNGEVKFDPNYIRSSVINKFGSKAFHDNFIYAFNQVLTALTHQ